MIDLREDDPGQLDDGFDPDAVHSWTSTLGDARSAEADWSGDRIAFSLPHGDPTIDWGSDPEATLGRDRDASAGPASPRVHKGFPDVGSTLAGFKLVSELGRGSFARVYLAEQANLGGRPVALKVSPAEVDESRALARLQHTHIVPIHSVHDDPETGLRLLCMPYFGGATLAQVLEFAGASRPTQATGRSLVEALDVVGTRPDPSPASISRRSIAPVGSSTARSRPGFLSRLARARPSILGASTDAPAEPARTATEPTVGAEAAGLNLPNLVFLRAATYVRAAAWIAARLAEGLDHAHARGLLHRDIKPSNVLIAADGTPMLLDFNLAMTAEVRAGGPDGVAPCMGGTLAYMSPEHLDAFNPRGSTPPGAVAERSDIYALGLILFEMVAGRHPYADPPRGLPLVETIECMTLERRGPVPSARAANPEVPWSLDALIAKCLHPDPARRYRAAREMAEDLRRFLADDPMRHTPEPSIRERLAKWSRRNPWSGGAATIALAATVVIGGLGLVLSDRSGRLRDVTTRLDVREFDAAMDECQLYLNAGSGPARHLDRGIALADRTLARFGVGPASTAGRVPAVPEALRPALAELVLLEVRGRVARDGRSGSEGQRRATLERAIARLDLAERLDTRPTAALYADRARYHAALGEAELAATDRAREAATPPTTCRDFYLLGTSMVARGQHERAEPLLLRASDLDPKRFWAWFALGHCRGEQGRHLEAAGDFAVCIALAPDFAWPHLNRGLALARAGRLVEARTAYDHALTIDPNFAEARVDRGLTLLELDEPAAARVDLDLAVRLGRRESGVLAALGEAYARLNQTDKADRLFDRLLADAPDDPTVRVARGVCRLSTDPSAARSDVEHVLQSDPRHARALYGLALLDEADHPHLALENVDRALDAEPGLIDALQLRALLRARLGDLSALDDADRLIQSPTPHRLYNAACAAAILDGSHPEANLAPKALSLLRRAIESGFPRAQAAADPDFASIRRSPEFNAILARSGSGG